MAQVLLSDFLSYFSQACEVAAQADILIVVGTSLNVYPAASLLHYAKPDAKIWFVDPGMPEFGAYRDRITHIRKPATQGVPAVVDQLIAELK